MEWGDQRTSFQVLPYDGGLIHQHGEQQRVRHHVVSLVHQVDSVGLGQVAQNVHGLVYTRDTTRETMRT